MQLDERLAAVFLDLNDLTVADHLDTVALQGRLNDGGGVAILAGQNLRVDLQQRHLRSEAGKALRQLAPDRPPADHREPVRQLRQ